MASGIDFLRQILNQQRFIQPEAVELAALTKASSGILRDCIGRLVSWDCTQIEEVCKMNSPASESSERDEQVQLGRGAEAGREGIQSKLLSRFTKWLLIVSHRRKLANLPGSSLSKLLLLPTYIFLFSSSFFCFHLYLPICSFPVISALFDVSFQ